MASSQQEFEQNARRTVLGMRIHPVVFGGSAGLIILFVILALLNAENLEAWAESIQDFTANTAGWFYVAAMNFFLVFVLYLLFSRYGNIRIGGPDAKPEFSRLSWISMLFAAGMGVGLYFNGVYEPIAIFTKPATGDGETVAAAQEAMAYTFLHWGLHPWGAYALIALAMAFAVYNRKLPMSIRSAFQPLFGDRVWGPLGDAIDIVAIVATLFGVATSLGLGAEQINAGLNYLYGVPSGVTTQMIIIAVITAIATTSVVSGLDAGIKNLSLLAMGLGAALLVLVFVLGPTLFILDAFTQNTGYYIQQLPQLSTWTESYQGTTWQNSWTLSYWAWWIAWSPFVGIFIARVSKGRTIREFLLGVLAAPTLVSLVWFTVFGGSALYRELYGAGGLVAAVGESDSTALFAFLEGMPLAGITSVLGIIGVAIFFITSSDSGSLVIDMISAGGDQDPPTQQRIFWAVLEGIVAAVLLLGGGLQGLQTAVITVGLPFAFLLVLMAFSLFKGLRAEHQKVHEDQSGPPSTSSSNGKAMQPPKPVTPAASPEIITS